MTRATPPQPRSRFARPALLVAGLALCLMLGGCLDRWFFSPDYSLTGLPENEEVAKNVKGYFDDEAAAILPPGEKDDKKTASDAAAEKLRVQMAEKMQSLGYYDATVKYTPDADPFAGQFAVDAGPRYEVGKVTIDARRLSPEEKEALKALYDLKGRPLDAESVLAYEAEAKHKLDRSSCRFGVEIEHTAYLDRKKKTADLDFALKLGPPAKIGPAVFSGQQTVKESYLQKLVPWKEGDCYQAQRVEKLRGALFESGLFGGVDIVLPEKIKPGASVPVQVTLTERAQHSINAGVTYYSDEGPGVSFGWQDRNLLGGAETLDATLKVSSLEQSLKSTLTSPFFLRQDQKLAFTAGLSHEDTDAYNSKSLDLGVSVSRQINRRLSLSTGVGFSLSRIFDNVTQDEQDYALVSFPQAATYDSRNNPLDATRGWMLEANVAPFVNTIGAASPFVKMSGSVRRYQPVGHDTTLALRGKVGVIGGTSLTGVPAKERFYAGGSGSVRGFGYQDIGPQRNGDPTGGRSLAEGSVEIRHKFTDTVGAVAFVDAGSLTETTAPDFSNLSVGAGVGLRYYTAVGPIRFDVAVPVNNQDETDKFQVYVSLGQAF